MLINRVVVNETRLKNFVNLVNVKKWYDRALNTVLNSDEIITISNSSKTDIVNFLNVTSKNITIAYCSVDKKIFNNNTWIREDNDVKV